MSKQKAIGTRFENEVVAAFELVGLKAERTGRIVGYPGDVEVLVTSNSMTTLCDPNGSGNLERHRIECKRRKRAWKDLYDWLDKNDTQYLAIRANHRKALAVMPLTTLVEFFKELHRRRKNT